VINNYLSHSRLKKFSLLVLIFFYFDFINPEYLLYEGLNFSNPISLESHKKIYPFLMKYQFPMSVRSSQNLRFELSVAELNFLCSDERGFLNAQADGLKLTVMVKFIPTTIYELFLMKFYAENVVKLYLDDKINSSLLSIPTFMRKGGVGFQVPEEMSFLMHDSAENIVLMRDVSSAAGAFNNSINGKRDFVELSCSKIYKSVESFHFKLNCFIAKYLKEKSIEPDDINLVFLLLEDVLDLAKKLKLCHLKKYGKSFSLNTKIFPYTFLAHSTDQIRFLLEKSVEVEKKAAAEGKVVLYRGSDGYLGKIDKVVKEKSNSRGLSFGNTLFSGIFVCPGSLAIRFVQSRNVGYALLVDKRRYYDEDSFERKFIEMRPWPTIALILGWGSSFHPKICLPREFFSKIDEAEELFQEYIDKNLVILRGKS
jgi:hypothetical protein